MRPCRGPNRTGWCRVRRGYAFSVRYFAGLYAVEFGQHCRRSGSDPDRYCFFADGLEARTMKRLFEQPWIWALLGVLGLWILLSIGAGQVNLGNLSGILAS